MIIKIPNCWRELVTIEFLKNACGDLYLRTINAATSVNEGPADDLDDPRPYFNDLREITSTQDDTIATIRLASNRIDYRAEILLQVGTQVHHDTLQTFNEIERIGGKELILVFVDSLEPVDARQTS